MKLINHFAALKMIFSTGVESIKQFRSYRVNIIHALVPGK